jgi:antagonist of KipI
LTEVFRVVEPGLLTTIQDLGRLGAIASGVPPGGAMDRFAHRAANMLVGNSASEATLECTLRGPYLVAQQACVVSITGADLGPQVNRVEAPMWTSFKLAPGDTLTFAGRRVGARAHIAVAGGFEGERWLGSRSTSLMTGKGGFLGRALRAGDALDGGGGHASHAVAGRSLDPALRPDYSDHALATLAGPHLRRLDKEARQLLFGATFTISPDANRMGYRLEGPTLPVSGDELLSYGLVAGAVQLPLSGRPILLMADHQTAGGYPVVAVVVSASMHQAAQLAPGDVLQFVEVTAAQARQRRLALSSTLASLSAL